MIKNNLLHFNESTSKEILSLDWVLLYLQHNFPNLQVKEVVPYTHALGTNNHNEGLDQVLEIKNSLFFGRLQLDINPNGSAFVAEEVTIQISSLFNHARYTRHLNRIIEIQNFLNEQTERIELFDRLSIENVSTGYDTYMTFIGFKLEVN